MINIYLLTGFLGSGKTTLLKTLLQSCKDWRIGVIINDFGELNIDAMLIKSEGVTMAELSNGSIFCACIKDKFVDSLIEMSAHDFDALFIEASGLADPANMSQILDGIKAKTVKDYNLAGSICVVDALHFMELVDLLPALGNQVEYANAVIINKADLVSDEDIQEIADRIAQINENTHTFVTSYCQVDFKEITSSFSEVLKEGRDTTNTLESRPSTFILKADEVLPLDAVQKFLEKIAPDTFRIKGFLKSDQGDRQISAVVSNINLLPWDETIQKTEIVVISSVGIKLLSSILAASKELLEGKLKL